MANLNNGKYSITMIINHKLFIPQGYSIAFFIMTFFLLNYPCSAQQNYLPGYIVTLELDTIKGFIDYRDWKENPNKIRFKELDTQESTQYLPKEIFSFGVSQVLFKSANVITEGSPNTLDKIDFDSEFKLGAPQTVFLQAIIRGTKNLFFYKDQNGKEHFYINHEEDFELLKFKKYFIRNDGKKVLAQNNSFRLQLQRSLQDCPELNSKLKVIAYSLDKLTKIFLDYYQCAGLELEYVYKREKPSLKTGIVGGLSRSHLSFPGKEYHYMANTDYPASNDISLGVSFEVIFPKNQGKWSLYNEMLYTGFNFQGRYDDVRSSDIQDIYLTEIEFRYIKLYNFLRFNYPIKGLKIYFNTGVSNGIAFRSYTHLRKESKFYSMETTWEGVAGDDPFRKHELGLVIGVGLSLKMLSVEVRVEKGDGISNYVPSSTRRIHALIGYRF